LFKTSYVYKERKYGASLLLSAKGVFQELLSSHTLTSSLVSSNNEEKKPLSCREYWAG